VLLDLARFTNHFHILAKMHAMEEIVQVRYSRGVVLVARNANNGIDSLNK
jgi:hypothetical protein